VNATGLNKYGKWIAFYYRINRIQIRMVPDLDPDKPDPDLDKPDIDPVAAGSAGSGK